MPFHKSTPRQQLQRQYMDLWRTLGGMASQVPHAKNLARDLESPEILAKLREAEPFLQEAWALLKEKFFQEFPHPKD